MSNNQQDQPNQPGRPARPARSIRGPQSALTDFLASHNIRATDIRSTAERRRAAAAAAAANSQNATNTETPNGDEEQQEEQEEDDEDDEEASPSSTPPPTRTRSQKRKQQQQTKAIEEIKKTRSYKKRKQGDDSDSDSLARALVEERITPLPGQMANCEICNKRFTVTPYSRAGPNGGLLCPKCSKEAAKDEDANKKKKKKPNAPSGAARSRRGMHSRILDGTYQTGAKPLMTLCIETLAKNIDLADDLGDLPAPLIDRISRLLSKRRLFDGRTLQLFLQPHAEDLRVYDAARLSSDDYIRIFQTLPKLKKLKLRNAIQFKDGVMRYLISRHIALDSIYLHGANLLTEDVWNEYLKAKGQNLKDLQVYFTDKHFNNNTVEALTVHCQSLARLKVCHNQEVSDIGIKHLADLQNLEHLSLQLIKCTSTEAYVHVINHIGEQLRTFSLKAVEDVDDRLLDALHDNCTSLAKLRITGSRFLTDTGFARLFKDWKNKPLTFIDLEECRQVDAANPRKNTHQIGLCSDGFRAVMNHSRNALRHLNIHACRHISREAFEDVFSIDNKYPELLNLEISFCEEVTDFIVGCIFRSCPNLKKLNIFGCMKVKDVRVPKGKLLVGLPNAMGMVIEGKDD